MPGLRVRRPARGTQGDRPDRVALFEVRGARRAHRDPRKANPASRRRSVRGRVGASARAQRRAGARGKAVPRSAGVRSRPTRSGNGGATKIDGPRTCERGRILRMRDGVRAGGNFVSVVPPLTTSYGCGLVFSSKLVTWSMSDSTHGGFSRSSSFVVRTDVHGFIVHGRVKTSGSSTVA